MKIKIVYLNDRGRIELTKEELEKLLNESYSEGYSDGCNSCYTISTPSYPYITYCNDSSIANKTISTPDEVTVSYDSGISTCATAISELATALNAAGAIDRCVADKTETIKICNVDEIGAVKTNEI